MESLDVMDIKQHNVKSIVNVLRFSAGESGLTKRCVADVSPVLVELKRSRLIRIQPYSAGLGLTHLLALRV